MPSKLAFESPGRVPRLRFSAPICFRIRVTVEKIGFCIALALEAWILALAEAPRASFSCFQPFLFALRACILGVQRRFRIFVFLFPSASASGGQSKLLALHRFGSGTLGFGLRGSTPAPILTQSNSWDHKKRHRGSRFARGFVLRARGLFEVRGLVATFLDWPPSSFSQRAPPQR